MKRFLAWGICLAVTLSFPGCSTASDHRKAVRAEGADRLTAGKVQREILEKALENAIFLMEECKILFEILDTKSTYERYFSAIRKIPIIPPGSSKI